MTRITRWRPTEWLTRRGWDLDDLRDDMDRLRDRVERGFDSWWDTEWSPRADLKPLRGLPDHRVRGFQDRLRGTVVLLQRDDGRRRLELAREIEDVAHGGAAKRVDRLRVVAHHREATSVGLQAQQDRGLQAVGVLVFVDQHVPKARADLPADRRLLHHRRPVGEQVVVVEHVVPLLGLDVGGEQPPQLALPAGAPGETFRQHRRQRLLGVDAPRVDGQAGALQREPLLGAGQRELVPHQGHQVGRVLAVVDREHRGQADARRVLAQQARADRVKGAGPEQGPISGLTLTWSASASIGTITQGGVLTAGTTVGAGIVRVISGSISAESAVEVVPGALDHIVVTPASLSMTVGSAASLSAVGYDQYGNALTGLTFAWSSSSGTITPVGDSSIAQYAASTVAGSATITATSGAVSAPVSVTVNPGPLAALSISPASPNIVAGGSQMFTATGTDVFGNVLSGLTFTWSASSTIGTITQTATMAAASRIIQPSLVNFLK